MTWIKGLVFAAAIALVVIVILQHYGKWKSPFMAVPELRCGPFPAPEYAVDVTGRGAAGTVTWDPDSRETFMSNAVPTSDTLMARATRRSPLPNRSVPSLWSDIDSDILSEGVTDSAVTSDMPRAGNRVTLKKKYINPARRGLGSTWTDPRFQPGSEDRLQGGGGASTAPGTYAGGISYGALTPDEFRGSAAYGQWDTTFVKGFGNQFGPDYWIGPIPTEALMTSSS
ncbi:MAG: hypothetical protein KGL39_24040 [Patescibacteria group bacterium]|nr:hypothetical protein [Patescibacteria group bacterium]